MHTQLIISNAFFIHLSVICTSSVMICLFLCFVHLITGQRALPGSACSTLMWLQHSTSSEIQQHFIKLPAGLLIPRYSFKVLHVGTLLTPTVINISDSMLQQLELIGFYKFIEGEIVCIEHSLFPLKPQQFFLEKRVFSQN